MKTLTSIFLMLSLATACASGPGKAELDAEVKRLCAIDGGVKVYEMVKLPADKFNQWGQINFYKPTQGENALGPEYLFKQDMHWYRRGGPNTHDASMQRASYIVVRRFDGKILAETVIYGRGGGDFPGPWHPSSFSCPEINEAGPNALLRAVFINSNAKGELP